MFVALLVLSWFLYLMKLTIRAGLLLALCLVKPAVAEITAGEFLRNVGAKQHRMYWTAYLAGITTGLEWYNSHLEYVAKEASMGDLKFFCVPSKLSLTANQQLDMLQRYVRQNPESEMQPLGMVAFHTYLDAFPCK